MRYGVLGPVEAIDDDAAVAVGGPQQRRLLALMLSRPGNRFRRSVSLIVFGPTGWLPTAPSDR